ncbi:MAG TPA: tetratricopeptide repeat protein, partial [Anaerolineaceae bacterium]|nr:tetratricopeptide repeat protein [Anaerolineaceae bacterium]
MKKIIIFLLFTLLLTACNLPFNQAEPTLVPTATTAPTATPQPTPTPTPTVPPTVRVEQGDALLLTGDYPAALQEFQAALNAAPDTETQAAALLGVGQTYAINGDCASALNVLQNLLTQYPQAIAAAPAYYQIAECHMQTGLPAPAAQEYLGYIQLRPGVLDAMMYEKRGDALQAAGDYLAAVEAYDAAIAASSGITDDLQIKKGS